MKLQIESFSMAVDSMKQFSESYLEAEQGYVNNWAQYISEAHMTAAEAVEYIRTLNTQTDRYAHLVDMDGYGAWTTYGGIDGKWSNTYKEMEKQDYNAAHTFINSMEKMFSADEQKGIQILGKYRIIETQQTVISVGTRVTIREADGTDKPYLLLRVIPVDCLKESWIFPNQYADAQIGMITHDGEYVIQSSAMKSRSFLDLIRGYNFQDNYNEVEVLVERLRTTDQGLMLYKDSRNVDCYWYYSSFGDGSNLDILGYIPAEALDRVEMNWGVVAVTCGILLILLILDVSYIMQANRRLVKAVGEAEEASAAKTRFLSSMSHDIRTPMNAVLGFTGIAQKNVNDPAVVADSLEKAMRAGTHLLTLINDILDISKIESGSMSLALAPFSVRKTLRGTEEIFAPRAAEKDIELTVSMELPYEYLIADELRLDQIFINLFGNAVKYTPKGGHIRIDVWEEENFEDKNQIRLVWKVTDDGIGMTQEFQESMYNSFSRATDSRIDKIEGSGLGLSIVKQLVDLMGGTLTCVSAPGEGSVFTVSLDLEKAGESDIASLRLEEEATASRETGEFSGMRLLVAEDNDLNWEIIAELLGEYGILCDRAENGQVCVSMLEASEEGQYDVVLMDIQMPVMDGRTAARIIRKSEHRYVRDIPIVAMTADAFAEDIKACLDAGMDSHISKPVDMNKVLRVLRKIESSPSYRMRQK